MYALQSAVVIIIYKNFLDLAKHLLSIYSCVSDKHLFHELSEQA